MILACQNIQKAFGTDVILKNASFHIEDREKAAIVGINGAGIASTSEIIMHQLDPDSGGLRGDPRKRKNHRAIPAQHDAVSSGKHNPRRASLREGRASRHGKKNPRAGAGDEPLSPGEGLENVLETYNRLNSQFERENGYAIQSEITGVLKGLGFAEEDFTEKGIHPLRWSEDPCGFRQASPLPSGSHPSGRAHQPPRYELHRLAGKPICSTIPEPCSSWPMTGIS